MRDNKGISLKTKGTTQQRIAPFLYFLALIHDLILQMGMSMNCMSLAMIRLHNFFFLRGSLPCGF